MSLVFTAEHQDFAAFEFGVASLANNGGQGRKKNKPRRFLLKVKY